MRLDARPQMHAVEIRCPQVLMDEIQKGQMKHLRCEVLERLLQAFPTSGRHWKMYCEALVADGKREDALAALEKAMPMIPQIDLWKQYILLTNTQCSGDTATMSKAYEKAVDAVGQDIGSNSLWGDYVTFLKNQKVSNLYEDGQRKNQLRRAYQRLLQVPMHGVDRFWGEYEAWEQSLDPNNVAQAEALVRAFEPKHKAARAAYKDRNKLRNAIILSVFPAPYSGDIKDKNNAKSWLDLIAFERSNPQKMLAEDLRKRVFFTYLYCLSYCPMYPDIWHQVCVLPSPPKP